MIDPPNADARRLYEALLGERLPTDVLCRHWLSGADAAGFVVGVLEPLPQPGCLEPLGRLDDHRHGPEGPVQADWPSRARVEGTVRYVAMVALAMHEHGEFRSSRPARELGPIAALLLPIVPKEWAPAIACLCARAQVV